MSADKLGRPSKFTPETRATILECLQSGATIKATCDSVGIAESTYFGWVDIGRAHINGEPHPHMPKTLEKRQAFSDFLEAVTRAQAEGLIHATIAFRQGMNPSETVSSTTETLEETRLDKEGKPYTYLKTVTRHTITRIPGDWRAAMEYLARRDPDNWARTAPQKVEHTGENGGAIIIKTGMSMDDL
jgi:transposase-like protein